MVTLYVPMYVYSSVFSTSLVSVVAPCKLLAAQNATNPLVEPTTVLLLETHRTRSLIALPGVNEREESVCFTSYKIADTHFNVSSIHNATGVPELARVC
jgi:hypothetical protein